MLLCHFLLALVARKEKKKKKNQQFYTTLRLHLWKKKKTFDSSFITRAILSKTAVKKIYLEKSGASCYMITGFKTGDVLRSNCKLDEDDQRRFVCRFGCILHNNSIGKPVYFLLHTKFEVQIKSFVLNCFP